MRWMILLLPIPAMAGDLGLIVDTWSHHRGDAKTPVSMTEDIPSELAAMYQPEWNEHNQAIGIEYIFDSGFSLTAATYTDSYERDTWYAGAGWMWPLYARGDFEVNGGGYALYFDHEGYVRDLEPPEGYEYLQFVMPSRSHVAPLPGLSIRYKMIGANLAVIPPIEDGVPWTGVLQLKLVF